MALEIIRNDITKVKADAIVNTANPKPIIGAGTDSAIHRAAGTELLEARREIGEIRCGESAVTPAFRLNAKYVIHTVGPVWVDGNHHEEELLRKAYDSALELARGKHCKSIAFPLLATGSYGFPHDLAFSIAIHACNDFLLKHRMHISLVVFNGTAYHLSQQLVEDVKAYIDENYVAEQEEAEYALGYSRRSHTCRAEQLQIQGLYQAAAVCEGQSLEKTRKLLDEQLKEKRETFSDALWRIMQEKNLLDPEVYGRIGMDRTTFNKIKNHRDHLPRRKTAIQLAFALRLNLDQTQDFIGKAGYILSKASHADILLMYCIQTAQYNPIEIDSLLDHFHEKALFSIKN